MPVKNTSYTVAYCGGSCSFLSGNASHILPQIRMGVSESSQANGQRDFVKVGHLV